METKKALGDLTNHVVQVLIVALILAVAVGIGSALTQFYLKIPVNYTLVAELAVVFGVIATFLGIVFALVLKHFPL